MRESEGDCRINAVSVARVVIEADTISAQATLLGKIGKTSVTFGNTVAKSGWPKEVTELASQLCEALEEHFAQTLFEEDDDGSNRTPDRGDAVPAGLVEFGLDTAGDKTEQL